MLIRNNCKTLIQPLTELGLGRSQLSVPSMKILHINGYTLFELIAVISIVSFISLIAFPNIASVNDISLKSDAKRLAGLISYLDNTALSKKMYHKLTIGPETIRLYSSTDGISYAPPKVWSIFARSTRISQIVFQGTVIHEEEAVILFTPSDGAVPFKVRLSGNGHSFNVIYNPYSGKIEVAEGDA